MPQKMLKGARKTQSCPESSNRLKSLDHEGDKHICAATVHACGTACDLIAADGTPICTRKCVIDRYALLQCSLLN
jgi:hypothetical protein